MEKVYKEVGPHRPRQALKLTQAEVARVGTIRHSGQIERGATSRASDPFSIAAALGVEPADLLPSLKGGPKDSATKTLDTLLSGLKPGKKRFLMGVVRDLADELK